MTEKTFSPSYLLYKRSFAPSFRHRSFFGLFVSRLGSVKRCSLRGLSSSTINLSENSVLQNWYTSVLTASIQSVHFMIGLGRTLGYQRERVVHTNQLAKPQMPPPPPPHTHTHTRTHTHTQPVTISSVFGYFLYHSVFKITSENGKFFSFSHNFTIGIENEKESMKGIQTSESTTGYVREKSWDGGKLFKFPIFQVVVVVFCFVFFTRLIDL